MEIKLKEWGEDVIHDDIIISKCSQERLPDGREINNVSGKRVKHATSGTVDKVILTRNREGLRKNVVSV